MIAWPMKRDAKAVAKFKRRKNSSHNQVNWAALARLLAGQATELLASQLATVCTNLSSLGDWMCREAYAHGHTHTPTHFYGWEQFFLLLLLLLLANSAMGTSKRSATMQKGERLLRERERFQLEAGQAIHDDDEDEEATRPDARDGGRHRLFQFARTLPRHLGFGPWL